MFKYVKFIKVIDDITSYEFRGGSDEIKVNYFDGGVASIESEIESAIDNLIDAQDSKINCEQITYDEFFELVRYSDQIKRINAQVKEKIALRYDLADEIFMLKKDLTDSDRLVYEKFVLECKDFGKQMKLLIGFKS